MMNMVWLSPPAAFIVFLGLAYALDRLGAAIAAPGEHHDDKHLAYTGGETVPPPASRLTYHAFFRLALLFGILHVAALVVSTLPSGGPSHLVALAYLAGVGISVVMLAGNGREG